MPDTLPYDGPDSLDDVWDAQAASFADAPPPDEPPMPVRGEGVLPLGHDRGVFYYFSIAAGQVYDLRPGEHTRNTMSAMASVPHYWETGPWMGKKGVVWEEAAAFLMQSCRDVGIYNPERVRGRGAWLDGTRTVLHAGDRLIVNGADLGTCKLPGTEYIYEQARRLDIRIANAPLDSKAASRLMDLCMAPSWEDPQSMGRLLAGWLVVAPVCGAMPWRPHLWITSEGGGGKSWVLENIVRPIVSDVAARFQSKTTEAGVRQTLGADARPVLFDEFEAEDDRARERVQQVLDLARQASTEDGAPITKGGQDGRAKHYQVRSMFAFSSINLNLGRAADESRTVVLVLVPSPDRAARAAGVERLKHLHAEIMTPEFPAALLARTLRLLPIIRHNAEVFAQAIARAGQSRRLGDTIGVLLAGAWSLRSTKRATAQEADDFIAGTSWVQAAMTRAETVPEWQRALAFLTQQRLRIVPHNGKPEDVPVGELLEIAAGLPHEDPCVARTDAERALSRAGLRIASNGEKPIVWLANTSQQITELFARSTWGGGWLALLSRAPGVGKEATKKFGSHASRVTTLPLGLMLGGEIA